MALLRLSPSQLLQPAETESVVERLLAQMLFHSGRRPSPGEANSWRASLPVLARELVDAGLPHVEMLIEHQLPLTSRRVDVVLAGYHPGTGDPSYVLVELKQWSHATVFEDEPELVLVDAYGSRPVLHPVEQVRGYCEYLTDFMPILAEAHDPVAGVAYLHNASEQGVASLRALAESRFGSLYTGDGRGAFREFLLSRLDPTRPGIPAGDALLSAHVGPSRQLLAVAADEVNGRERFTLLAEQRLAFRSVLHAVDRARVSNHKQVIVVSGGPGSGKSVIALSLMGALAAQGRSVVHATGSQSFTKTMRKVAGRGSPRVQKLFRYFNQFMDAETNGLDVLIADEAHRIRETSVSRYTKAVLRTERPQVDELISAARVPVFLLDDYQVVRPGELGSVAEITAYAGKLGLDTLVINLNEQFRCGGSDLYIRWVKGLLGLEGMTHSAWVQDPAFGVHLVESPEEMASYLVGRRDAGFGARITAGFCWPWSDPVDGGLVDDVVIGGWSRPWNVKGDRAVGSAPPSALWATEWGGFDQVGCIYTAQGFEYDWNGVIFGSDLVRRGDSWIVQRDQSRDPALRSVAAVSDAELDQLLRNVYKVLLTRAMIGTLIYSTDAETQAFLRSLLGTP
jgi:hypothetical protein